MIKKKKMLSVNVDTLKFLFSYELGKKWFYSPNF